MNFETVWEKYTALPPDAQRMVIQFMNFLQQRYDHPQHRRKITQQHPLRRYFSDRECTD
jgi:hypothetical protein